MPIIRRLPLLGLLSLWGCSAAHPAQSPPPHAQPSDAFAAIIDRLCPPLVEARCESLNHCECAPRSAACPEGERARCEGWVRSVYTVVGDAEHESINTNALRDCLAETRARLETGSSCSVTVPSPTCMRLLAPTYRASSEAPPPAMSGAGRGERCDASIRCAAGLACVHGQCAGVAHCSRIDDDCGVGMRCAVDHGTCEREACDPWRFWNTDMTEN